MAKIERFEDIVAWQKAEELSLCVYDAFRTCKDYSFRDQIQRAAVSVMNNIAEGFERKGNKEFRKFLYISKGSCGEVRSMLYLSLKLGYIDSRQYSDISELSLGVSRMLSGFIKKLDLSL